MGVTVGGDVGVVEDMVMGVLGVVVVAFGVGTFGIGLPNIHANTSTVLPKPMDSAKMPPATPNEDGNGGTSPNDIHLACSYDSANQPMNGQ